MDVRPRPHAPLQKPFLDRLDLQRQVLRSDAALGEAAGDQPQAWLAGARVHVAQFLPVAETPKMGRRRETDMNPIPGTTRGVRDDSAVRRAAMLVIDELGESAADYAETRAIVLQRQGDDMGASIWRRIAPLIEEMQRKKSAGSN